MADKRDYYSVLGVDRNADKDTIKKAYRKLAMKYHPDRNPGKESEAQFKEASEAAEILLDSEKKSRYDQFGHAGVDGQAGHRGFSGGGGFGDINDIFGDIFGDIMGGSSSRGRGSRNSRARHGSDMQTSINIDFLDAAFGAVKNLSINKNVLCPSCHGNGGEKGASPTTCPSCNGHGEVRRQQGFFTIATTCPKCHGSGQIISNPCKKCKGDGTIKKTVDLEVKIPAGIDNDQRLKLSGEGNSGILGGVSGDLYLQVHVSKHDFFERDEYDIYCKVPISFSQAALGSQIEVPTLIGKVEVKIPSGTQSGKKMRLKGKGIQQLGRYGGVGDQILEIHVETPVKLGPEQKELFEKLSEYKSDLYPMSQNFFEKVKNLFQ